MAEKTHRERTIGDMRRMLERFETAAVSVGAPGSAVRGRYADEAAVLKDALHYLTADQHLEKAQAVRRTADPDANALIEAMLPQLLILLVHRLGGDVLVPVDEIDAVPARFNMHMASAPGVFRFVNVRK